MDTMAGNVSSNQPKDAGENTPPEDDISDEVVTLAEDLKASARAAAAEASEAVREKATEGQARLSEQTRETTARKIHQVADSVKHRSALPQAEAIDNIADAIDQAADYFRTHPYSEMREDLESRVRQAPLVAVVVAFLVGYFLGSLLGRSE